MMYNDALGSALVGRLRAFLSQRSANARHSSGHQTIMTEQTN
jgi:hypothetical protein